MGWMRARFLVPDSLQEVALALIGEGPFSAFEEGSGWLDAYGKAEDCDEAIQVHYAPNSSTPWRAVEWAILPDENWNKQWELHFDPVIIDAYCAIRATFHEPIPDVRFEIVIQPEMAFGTGHHATTRMMIEGIQIMDVVDKRVLDFGAGTAVLAILAAMIGATHVDAVEIEGPACESAQANIQRNNVSDKVTIYHGDSTNIPDAQYDLILANINRNVILEELDTLDRKLMHNGILGISGFLVSDREMLNDAMTKRGFQLLRESQRLDWLSQWWNKPKHS